MSPGSTPVHSMEDSETSSLASLDEQFYTEAYPNKLCAFCNLSEKSFLGQGDMVKYTINEATLKEFVEKKNKKEGGERDESPSERSKSPNTGDQAQLRRHGEHHQHGGQWWCGGHRGIVVQLQRRGLYIA